jgi:hypothetical protein
MTRINIRHCLRASSSAIGASAERACPAGRLSTLVRAAMVCGALAVTAGWDAAGAQPDAGQKELDKYKQSGGQDKVERDYHLRQQRQTQKEKVQQELDKRDAAFARSQRATAEAADNDGRARVKPRRDRVAERDAQRGRHAQRDRNAGEGRHYGAPVRRAYKHYRAERRQFGRAAARFVRHPRYGTYRRLGREYRQARTARGHFYRSAARYARSSHYAGARPLRRAYGHYRVERRQFYRAAARFARTPRYGSFQGLRRQFGQVRSARVSFRRAAVGFARRR